MGANAVEAGIPGKGNWAKEGGEDPRIQDAVMCDGGQEGLGDNGQYRRIASGGYRSRNGRMGVALYNRAKDSLFPGYKILDFS